MDKRFAIFDMDGTIVDSMPAWRTLGADFLRGRGITPPEDLRKKIAPLTMPETAEYFKTLGVTGTTDEIAGAINAVMRERYLTMVPAKQGVVEYLTALRNFGVRLCVCTATDSKLASACLKRLGLLSHFEFIVSCEDLGVGKTEPTAYHACIERFGCGVSEAAVFEDAPYAAKTAKAAGFYLVGVYDYSPENRHERLEEICDEYIKDYFTATKKLAEGGKTDEIHRTAL